MELIDNGYGERKAKLYTNKCCFESAYLGAFTSGARQMVDDDSLHLIGTLIG